MSWIGWVAIGFGALIGVDVLFVCTVITIAWMKEWMYRRNR